MAGDNALAIRSHETAIDAAREQVVDAVRDVLSRKPYRDTWEETDGSHFESVLDPGWWWIPLPMSVEIRETDGRVFVRATNRTAWFMVGDAFDSQYRCLCKFFKAVKKPLPQARSACP